MSDERFPETPAKKVKFAFTPQEKMDIVIAALRGPRCIRSLSRYHLVSRPTIYAWCRRLQTRRSIQAIFGDKMGRGTFQAVLSERNALREKLRTGGRKSSKGIFRRYGNKRCVTCGQWLPKKK